jgi:hypothetical protein
MVLEAGSASLSWGSRGLERNFCMTGRGITLRDVRPLLLPLPVVGVGTADELEAVRFTAVDDDAS